LKALVAFGTKYGSTEKVAEKIAAVLRAEGNAVTVLDLRTSKPVEISAFDLIVVGSGICIGSWSKGAQRFLEKNREKLAEKRVALFACSGDVMFGRSPIDQCRRMYLDDVAHRFGILNPVSTALFGGEIDFDKYGFLVKAVLKKVGASKNMEEKGIDLSKPYDFRDWGEIRAWARSLVQQADETPPTSSDVQPY
jgi:menaquinone-dependent protoporphyrinogen oxidase